MTDSSIEACAPKKSRRLAIVAALVAGIAAGQAMFFGCSVNEDPSETPNPTSTSTTGPGGAGGEGGGGLEIDAGPSGDYSINPKNPTLKLEVPMQGQVVQFTCLDTGTGLPAAVTWSLSNPELGAIDPGGLFTPNGQRTGDVTVTCKGEKEKKAETKLTVLIHAKDNPGGLTQQQIDALKGPPGGSDPSWQFLYPYDKTVFPRGILAPEIHLTTGAQFGSAFYVSIVAPNFEYEGFFGASSPQLTMSQAAWEALTNSAGGQKVEVRVAKLNGSGQKIGPMFRTWTIASGKLHGTIYYNTYDSPQAGSGAIMRIKGNSLMPEVLVGNCTVCHSVSSDGSVASGSTESFPYQGWTWDLTGGQLNPPILWQIDSGKPAFAAIYPTGDVLVVNGSPPVCNLQRLGGEWLSELRTKTGTIIPNSGIEGYYAQTPVFSHDGTKIAFYDRAANGQWGNCPGVLATMDYDAVTQKFTNYQAIAVPPPQRHYGWPAFTPDGKWVIYQNGVGDNLQTTGGNTGRMFAINLQTKDIVNLSALNGDGYVPQGARDEDKNYEPTTAPIASGGYFWVMFTSRRTYGNKLMGSDYETKRLWVAAVDINAQGNADFSHPAFYLSGQELASGNSRGFWALDPCKQDGQGCESGDECCNGFCNAVGDPPEYKCGPPDGSCSDEFELCESAADCCEGRDLECINGVCSILPPQ